MNFNSGVIKHYQESRVPFSDLKSMVKIAPDHLAEKSSWFMLDGKLQYFKERDTMRMFMEIFSEAYGKELGFRMAEYEVAYLREVTFGTKVGESKMGLISPNYQLPEYNYYLISDLLNCDISNLGVYGLYSLSNLITFLRTEYYDVEGVDETIKNIIELYCFDFSTDQEDRNPKNLCLEVLAEPSKTKGYWGLHGRKVKEIHLATIFDSERSGGIVKTPEGYELLNDSVYWDTAMPYADDMSDYQGFGVDPNILALYYEEPNIAGPIIEKMAREATYEKVIKDKFSKATDKICLSNKEKKFLIAKFLGRQEEFKRVLTL